MKIHYVFAAIVVAGVAGALVYVLSQGSGGPALDAEQSRMEVIQPSSAGTSQPQQQASAQETSQSHATADGLVIEDIVIGGGAEARMGMTVTVNYIGTLENGKKFDSSYDRGTPFEFLLGQGMVIRGWEEGIQGMRVGGTRKLTIPSSLGYGERGAGAAIPPNVTLIFQVELLGVK